MKLKNYVTNQAWKILLALYHNCFTHAVSLHSFIWAVILPNLKIVRNHKGIKKLPTFTLLFPLNPRLTRIPATKNVPDNRFTLSPSLKPSISYLPPSRRQSLTAALYPAYTRIHTEPPPYPTPRHLPERPRWLRSSNKVTASRQRLGALLPFSWGRASPPRKSTAPPRSSTLPRRLPERL